MKKGIHPSLKNILIINSKGERFHLPFTVIKNKKNSILLKIDSTIHTFWKNLQIKTLKSKNPKLNQFKDIFNLYN